MGLKRFLSQLLNITFVIAAIVGIAVFALGVLLLCGVDLLRPLLRYALAGIGVAGGGLLAVHGVAGLLRSFDQATDLRQQHR